MLLKRLMPRHPCGIVGYTAWIAQQVVTWSCCLPYMVGGALSFPGLVPPVATVNSESVIVFIPGNSGTVMWYYIDDFICTCLAALFFV